MRTMFSVGLVVGVAVLLAAWLSIESRAQAPERSALAGVWTRNHELSDPPPASGDRGERRDGARGRRGGGGFGGPGGGAGRGGFGGGGFGRGGGRMGDREETARSREAMRDVMEPPDQLTITQTESMIALTGPDGRTTRLSPDGKKIKDENTGIERRTRWEAGKLISEISGAGPGRITQTFSVDAERHQLQVAVHMEGGRGDAQPRTITYIYDSGAR